MTSPDHSASVPAQRRPTGAPPTTDLVVVAVDGSEASVRALVWALEHASTEDLRVEVLTTWPLRGPVFVREVAGHFCEPRWEAREAQAAAAAHALALVADAPPHDLRVENAELIEALVRIATFTRPALVVLGSDRAAADLKDTERLTARVRRAVPGRVVIVGPEGPVGRTPDGPSEGSREVVAGVRVGA